MSVWTIVVAAGSGARFGGPKQLAMLADRPVLTWAVEAAAGASDGVVVVVPADRVDEVSALLNAGEDSAPGGGAAVVAGGATRSESVRRGLAAVGDDASIVLVHDGARPLADVELFAAVIDAVRDGAECAIPVAPVTDTIRHVDGGVVDRETLAAVQTPQAFAAPALRAAHASAADATDDAGLVEAAGGKVVHVASTSENLKITTPIDLVVAEAILDART